MTVGRASVWTVWTLSAGLSLAGAVSAHAATRQVLAPVGGAYGQTVRLTVAASAGARCALSAGLLVPAQPAPVEARELDLAPGQIGVVDVSVTRLLGRPGRRVELLPYVEPRAGSCLVSTEVFEQVTGRTMALSKAVIAGFDPQPDPPAELRPAAAGDRRRARTNRSSRRRTRVRPATRTTGAHCTAILAFADARGATVGRTLAIDLGEGEAATLDLDPSLLLPATPGRPARHRPAATAVARGRRRQHQRLRRLAAAGRHAHRLDHSDREPVGLFTSPLSPTLSPQAGRGSKKTEDRRENPLSPPAGRGLR